jgi:hypothetical protein
MLAKSVFDTLQLLMLTNTLRKSFQIYPRVSMIMTYAILNISLVLWKAFGRSTAFNRTFGVENVGLAEASRFLII